MMHKILSLVAGAMLLAFAGSAQAGQLMPLSDGQMDVVTAGGTAIANAATVTFGEVTSDTITLTSTNVSTAGPTLTHVAIAESFSQGLAVGGFLFDAASISHSDSAASLP